MVEDAVHMVVQIFYLLTVNDSCKDVYGNIDFQIYHQCCAYNKEDDHPSQVKPVPIIIILLMLRAHAQLALLSGHNVVNMVMNSFYFLL
jgi:hypothetical protein